MSENKSWRDYAPDDPEAVPLFVEYLIMKVEASGWRNELHPETQREKRLEAIDEVLDELIDHVDNYWDKENWLKRLK